MKISNKPTSHVLVGILFIIGIFSGLASAEPQLSALEKINEFEKDPFYSRHYEMSSDWGSLKVGGDTVFFPWSRHQVLPGRPQFLDSDSKTSPKKEEILLDSSNSSAKVKDLSAINALKQRDVDYSDSQNGDPKYQGLANTLGISVSGDINKENGQDANQEDFSISVADEADDPQSLGNELSGQEIHNNDIDHAGNYLSVNVQDISVSAINTMEGGSAVATSNIIIKPVQIIVCPSEVEEKLK